MMCKMCGKEFVPKCNQKTCSTKCSNENIKALKRKWYGTETKICKWCGKEFKPHGSHVTCSKVCSLENKRQSRRRSYQRHKPDRYTERIRLKMWRIAKRVEKRYDRAN